VGFDGGLAGRRLSLSLALRAHAELPHRDQGERLLLELGALCARAGLRAAYTSGNGHETALELLGGPCWARVTPVEDSKSGIEPRSARELSPSLGASLAHGVELGPLAAVLGLSLDVDPLRTYYAVRVDGTRRRELTPWPLAPGAFVALRWP
jgi:hypothetical protein